MLIILNAFCLLTVTKLWLRNTAGEDDYKAEQLSQNIFTADMLVIISIFGNISDHL